MSIIRWMAATVQSASRIYCEVRETKAEQPGPGALSMRRKEPAPGLVTAKELVTEQLRMAAVLLGCLLAAACVVTASAAPYDYTYPYSDFGSGGIEVTFADAQGKTDEACKALSLSVRAGDKVTLPQVPKRDGMAGEGWALTAGSSKVKYLPGTVLTITKSICFYEVQSPVVTAAFIGAGGKKAGSITVKKGEAITFPYLKNTARYSFLGWHTKKGRRRNPKYLTGQKLKLNKDMTFYGVWYKRASDKVPARKAMLLPDPAVWRQVVIVGDSRMVHTRVYLKNHIGKTRFKNLPLTFVAKPGITLGDFLADENGEQKLLRILTKGDTTLPAVLIYNLGINELRPGADVSAMAAFAIRFLMNLRWKLDAYNVRFYLMSVNPVNDGIAARSLADIVEYNRLLRIGTAGAYDYIDTFTWLNRNGYTTLNDEGTDDGMHYSAATSLRIFNYAMEAVKFNP